LLGNLRRAQGWLVQQKAHSIGQRSSVAGFGQQRRSAVRQQLAQQRQIRGYQRHANLHCLQHQIREGVLPDSQPVRQSENVQRGQKIGHI
jgi:hypothetical protein